MNTQEYRAACAILDYLADMKRLGQTPNAHTIAQIIRDTVQEWHDAKLREENRLLDLNLALNRNSPVERHVNLGDSQARPRA